MIGVYDSGVGGLSVWKELYGLMPAEDFIYFADNAHCPYGDKPVEYIRDRARRVTSFFVDKGVEIVVVACNTATAAAIDLLRSEFSIPFVGMEPAIKPAALATKSGVVGILATTNTFKGSIYRHTREEFASDIKVIEVVGHGLVEAVESSIIPYGLLERYVGEIVGEGADVIVLGCTHFPFLQDQIQKIAGNDVLVINPAPAVARHTAKLLGYEGGSSSSSVGKNLFYSSGSADSLKGVLKNIYPFTPDLFHAELE